jgi:uncharacterized protein involved in type VI secretion and phage assembly
MSETKKYYGLYRATVFNNIDPLQMGRLQLTVPDVSNTLPTTWALPCVPVAGKQMGIFVLPLLGAGVWVQFEQGDPDFPVWSGGFWGSSADLPSAAKAGLPTSPSIVLQTAGQNSIVISDLPGTGGIEIKCRTGAKITISDIGITLDNGKGATVELTGPSVAINQAALKVT